MKTRRTGFWGLAGVAALGLCGVAWGAAGPQGGLVGQAAPEIQAQYWLNAPALSLAALRGRVVVVEFWATWCPPCRASIPHLIEMSVRYGPKGVVFIGLTDEPKPTVEPFVSQMNMTYAVGGGSMSGRAYGVSGIPHAFIVDPSGVVVWEGHPMGGLEEAVEEQLMKTPPASADKEKDPAQEILDRVGEEIQKRNYVAAAEHLAEVATDGAGPDIKRRVEGYRAALAKAAVKSLADAEQRASGGAYYEASVLLETAAKLAPGTDTAKRAEARLAELLADEKARPAIEQGRETAAAEALARLETKQAGMAAAEVAAALDEIASKWPGTKAGREAAERAVKARADNP